MKHHDQKSSVMKSANSAATRTVGWSSAKQDFAHRVTTSGSAANKATSATTTSTNAKSAAASALTNRKK
jgi:hypothetical protein